MKNEKKVYFDPDTKTVVEAKEPSNAEVIVAFFNDENTRKFTKSINKLGVQTTVSMVVTGVTMPFAKSPLDKVFCRLGGTIISGIIVKKMEPMVDEYTDAYMDKAAELVEKVSSTIEDMRKDN